MHVLEMDCIPVAQLAVREWRQDEVLRGLRNIQHKNRV
jgi:hypothetical protein